MTFSKWFSLLATLSTVVVVDADLFTSVHEMENLAHYEQRLLEHLQSYLLNQQIKLDFITQKYDELSNRRVDNTPQNNLGNPITAFALVKRLVRDWPLVLNLLVENYVPPNHLTQLPREKELESALRGLARLKDVYSLSATQLANGMIGDMHDQTIMTASDCYDMGKYSYERMQYYTSISWFNEATKKIQNGDKTVQQEKVLAHMFLASSFAGCLVPNQTFNSNRLLQQLLSDFPNFTLSHELSRDYKEAWVKNCTWIREVNKKYFDEDNNKYDMIYKKMCRRDFNMTTSGLRCYYVHYGNPRLLIAPFKLEEIHLDPPLIVFHDVISNHEIEKIKSNFLKNWKHCNTSSSYTSTVTTYRTCESAKVTDKDPTSAQLSRRVCDMTDLSIDTSEENQVACYGLGGEFKLHYDLTNESLSEVNHEGNRLATLMFYLSDVESGGYTVFPELHKAVTPRKGTALFWFNMDAQGKRLGKMIHGGCPVLQGTKLVLNKWIHEGNQDFEKLCPSDRNFPKRQFYLNTKR
uniref:procollagen-proline 4-dioxygenase n=1 Tax=Homalodisca liturata TaxID=320908 RepID=A0A1B6HE26_9HEMI